VIECAAASGLWRLEAPELNPRQATTFGTGELIRAALEAGCREVIIGLGGSVTNDGGAGMAQALGFRLLDAAGKTLEPGGAALARLNRIDASDAYPALSHVRFLGATDVTNPLCGPQGASAVYGPQKGADAAAVSELDAALRYFAAVIERDLGVSVLDTPGAGAAGGLGAGLIAFLGAELRPGAEVVADAAGLASRVAAADVVLTGEGRLDSQTAYGKTTLRVARFAAAAGRACVSVAGALGSGFENVAPFFAVVETAAKEDKPPAPTEAGNQVAAAAVRALLRLTAGTEDVRLGV
jgi:glycerate kinase